MKKVMMTVIAGILFPLLLVPVQGQEKEIKNIGQLSPDDKKAEPIGTAPSFVSLITAEDIRKMGATSLYEVLSYVPGIDLTETYFGYTSVSVRGNLQTHYNNKTLLLINNHPLYESVTGSFYLEQIPVNLIKRIEIIREPGSTLYGTNAYAGVIKIITWEGADLKGGTAHAQYGSFSSLDGGLVLGGKSGDFQFSAGATVGDSKGYDYRLKADEDGRSQTIKYKNDFANVMGSASYRGLSLNFGYFHNTKDKFGLVPTLVSSGEKVLRGFFLDASWQWQVAANMSMKLMTYYDSLDMNADIGWYPPSYALQQAGIGEHEKAESFGAKMGIDLRASYAPASGINLVGGLAYEYQKTDPYTFLNFDTGAISSFQSSPWLDNHSTYDLSGYLQLDARLSEKWGLVGGLRYNYNQDYGSRVAPKAGLVFNATEKLSLKLLYGRAFRNPNFFEKYVATKDVLYGDPALNPESIDTIDVGMDYMISAGNSLHLNYFYLSTADLIARSGIIAAGDPVKGNTKATPQYTNSRGQKISGFEAEARGLLVPEVRYFANVSFLSGREKADDSTVMFIPRWRANAGFNCAICSGLTVSPYVQYVGAKEGKLSEKAGNSDIRVDPYFLMNLNIEYSLNRNFRFMVCGRNLANQEYAYPEYIRRNIAETPGGPGIAFYGRIDYTFDW